MLKIKAYLQSYGIITSAGAFSFFRQTRFKGFSGTQQMKALEACLTRNPDAIFVHKLHLMCPLMRTHKKLPPVYFDLDDIEHIAFKRSINQLPKWYEKILNYIQLPMLVSGELRAIRLAHKTFVCSDLDRHYITKRWNLPGVVTVPNAVTIPAKQTLTMEPTILFIGTYSYKPNIDAAEFLINKVWPGIYKIMPQAKLLITGAHPERIRSYGSVIPNVTFTGFVDDLDALYHKTRIVCAPIFAGGGTRVKIVEAAAYGKPVVATKIGAEGLELHDGKELFLRDDAESFTEACLQLLKDYALCERMGAAAHAKAVQLYDRNNILELIQKHINSVPLNPLPSRKVET